MTSRRGGLHLVADCFSNTPRRTAHRFPQKDSRLLFFPIPREHHSLGHAQYPQGPYRFSGTVAVFPSTTSKELTMAAKKKAKKKAAKKKK
jgi:hypothetical protein